MTVAHTSISAYHDIDRSCIRAYIAGVVAQFGPMTRRQISEKTSLETSCVSGRVKELLDAGSLKELPETAKCPISGVRVKWVAFETANP